MPQPYCVVVGGIKGVAQAKHGVAQALQVRPPIAEVGGRFLKPLAEPLGVVGGLPVGVGGHQEHRHTLAVALGDINEKTQSKEFQLEIHKMLGLWCEILGWS